MLALQSALNAGEIQWREVLAPALACEGDMVFPRGSVCNLGSKCQPPLEKAEIPGSQRVNGPLGAGCLHDFHSRGSTTKFPSS